MSWRRDMPKFTYVAIDSAGQRTTGVERAPSREAVELALYERELSDIRVSEKRGLLKAEVLAPRVKREEVMHMSRQLGAFIRAGLPLLEAVRVLGAEARNSSVRRML